MRIKLLLSLFVTISSFCKSQDLRLYKFDLVSVFSETSTTELDSVWLTILRKDSIIEHSFVENVSGYELRKLPFYKDYTFVFTSPGFFPAAIPGASEASLENNFELVLVHLIPLQISGKKKKEYINYGKSCLRKMQKRQQ